VKDKTDSPDHDTILKMANLLLAPVIRNAISSKNEVVGNLDFHFSWGPFESSQQSTAGLLEVQ
jgi:hypothetical protein